MKMAMITSIKLRLSQKGELLSQARIFLFQV